MDYYTLTFLAVFALVVGSLVFRRLKYGSWSGAMLGGTIEHTYGQVQLQASGVGVSETLKVVEMRGSDGQAFVGLVITDKALTAASMTPYRLSKDQARELSALLVMAAKLSGRGDR